MQTIKRVLLTGDDGYNSLGTRLLAHFLKDQYQLTIVGTRTQQSAVGGKMSLKDGFNWGKTEVDGVEAFWVDGTPADAMEFATDYFLDEPFDLALSGINWGANLGFLLASGTANAALRALATKVAQRAIGFSWDLPPEFYFFHHDAEHSLEEYLEYPGKMILPLLDVCLKNNFFDTTFLNINFPQQPSHKSKITHFLEDATKVYAYGPKITGTEGHYAYNGKRLYETNLSDDCDVKAITDGFISITPGKFDLQAETAYLKFKSAVFEL